MSAKKKNIKNEIIKNVIYGNIYGVVAYIQNDMHYLSKYFPYKKRRSDVDYVSFLTYFLERYDTFDWNLMFRKMLKNGHFDLAKVIIDTSIRLNYGMNYSLEIACELRNEEFVRYIKEKSPKTLLKPYYLHVCKNANILRMAEQEDKYAIKNFLYNGNIVGLKMHAGKNVDFKLGLTRSNPECVKYFFKRFPGASECELELYSIDPRILLDDECIDLLKLRDRIHMDFVNWNCLVSSKIINKIIMKYLTPETKDKFDPIYLLRTFVYRGNSEILGYFRELYDLDINEEIIKLLDYLGDFRGIYKIMKEGLFSWRPEYNRYLKYVFGSGSYGLFSAIKNSIKSEDLDNEEIFHDLLRSDEKRFLPFILKNYDVDYQKYVMNIKTAKEYYYIRNHLDVLWNPKIVDHLEYFFNKGFYKLIYNMITVRNVEIPDKYYKKYVFGREIISLGFAPMAKCCENDEPYIHEYDYEYEFVSVLNCRYPELLISPEMKKISIWHSGFGSRLREYPLDVRFEFF